MRNALRIPLATVVAAGVVLIPVATAPTAFAAPASAGAKPADSGRYDGLAISIAPGYIAVLRNHTSDGGGQAWIRAVGADWKPSDGVTGTIVTLLDRDHEDAKVAGLTLHLGPRPPRSPGWT